jgi:hypothetical protein
MHYNRAAEIRSIRKKLSTEAREGFRIAEFIKYECIMMCVKEKRQKADSGIANLPMACYHSHPMGCMARLPVREVKSSSSSSQKFIALSTRDCTTG